jgi:hypothetical protein
MILDGPPQTPANVKQETSTIASERSIGAPFQEIDMLNESHGSPPMAGSATSSQLAWAHRQRKIPARYKDSKKLLGKRSYNQMGLAKFVRK